MNSETNARAGTTNWIAVLLVGVTTLVMLLPLFVQIAPRSRVAGQWLCQLVLFGPMLIAAFACYRRTHIDDHRDNIRDVVLLCLIFTLLTTYLHRWLVDSGTYAGWLNLDWQLFVQKAVMKLDPAVLPHSYRFLPNSYVRLLESITGSYEIARDSYRNLFDFLLFFAIYRFARLYLAHGGGLLTLVLFAAVFPVSFQHYAGQLTDPMSHLSFVLAFIFIETGQFVYLLLTVLIGALAKETVLAMAGYYGLLHWRNRRYWPKAAALLGIAFTFYFGVRIAVLHGTPNYSQISGVSLGHVTENLRQRAWHLPLLFTVGTYLPFVVLAFRTTSAQLQILAGYLAVVLFVSSALFSWLIEVRNFMPLVVVLALITAQYLCQQTSRADCDRVSGHLC